MPLETELKMRVQNHDAARQALQAAGAKFIRRELETNTFLDTPDERLLAQGAGLRVRMAQNLDTGEARYVITHKGPRRAGAMKIREETEVAADSYDGALDLLVALGHEVKLSFQKKRDTWELDDCEVVLDTLPEGLGQFVEIEGPDADAVNAVRKKLQLSDATVEAEGYAVLVSLYLKATGRRVLTFED